MDAVMRGFESEEDFWRMRDFLRRVLVLNQHRERSWHVARLEYARWHTLANCAQVPMAAVTRLWEAQGELAGFVMPDGGPGEAHLCVHPALRTRALEEEMIAAAEARLAEDAPGGGRRLTVWANQGDGLREEILSGRGYHQEGLAEHQWRRRLDTPVAEAPLAAGYTIRALGDGLELLERCYASGLGFHEGDIRVAVDNRSDPGWYRNIQTAPLYRRDLDLVAVAPDGSTAAFCTIWFDDVTRSAYFEPVATVPAHQRQGLGRALLSEGLRRLQRMGATMAFVGGFTPAANALYRAVMGADHELYAPWMKAWPA